MVNKKQANAEANKRLRENRKARGECTRCGKINDRVGKANCSECQLDINAAVKKNREMKKNDERTIIISTECKRAEREEKEWVI